MMGNDVDQRLAQARARGHLSPEEENDPEMVRQWRADQKLEDLFPKLESDPPVIAVNREVPSEIGKYRIERKLGDGAFGEVYKGYDVELERSVALKRPLVPPSQGDSSFVREARSASNITSQYVVTIHDVLTDVPSGPWIVSEFVDGGSMCGWIKKKRSLKKRILLFYYVVTGVRDLHAQNVIHRDLKPENILVGKDGVPRVADFGLAKQLRAETLQTQTQQGDVKGTLQYMAPEQLRGYTDKIDERSDIFALGVILYELLTGIVPFQGKLPHHFIKQIDKTAPVHPFLTADGQSLKEEENGKYIAEICLRCIRKDHRQRYQSARELLVDLKRCYENKPKPEPSEKPSPPATEENTSEPRKPVADESLPNKKARTVPRWYQRGPFKPFYYYNSTVLKKYAVFEGRARRPEFWYFCLFYVITYFVLGAVDLMLFGDQKTLVTIFGLAFLVPSISVVVRRLHDTNRSGWWTVIGLIPLVGILVLLVFFSQDSDVGENAYGPEEPALAE